MPRLADLGEVDWRLGVAAAALDSRGRAVVLADGTRLPYDRVLIAIGVRNRPWPHAGQAALRGRRGIRTREDSRVIRDLLDAGPDRVLVVGAGFTGSEVASVCRQRGVAVMVVERAENPLAGPLGGVVGEVAAGLHWAAGVDLRCSVTVEALEGRGGRSTPPRCRTRPRSRPAWRRSPGRAAQHRVAGRLRAGSRTAGRLV
jgi:NADPH-dependent 2,4-dienoyl-CoA reductase/sulfur reductase-like enzyme